MKSTGIQQPPTGDKLIYEDFSKVKFKEPTPAELYDSKEQAFNHLFVRLDTKESRARNVGMFMSGLQKDMEDRKMKERREEMKKKINQKVPPKVNLEHYLTDKAI